VTKAVILSEALCPMAKREVERPVVEVAVFDFARACFKIG
jgi:hypothetical protein